MANVFLKAQQIVAAAIGILERKVVLPQLVWRDAAIDAAFTLAKDDTVSIRLPAYMTPRHRVMRSGTGYTVDSLAESKVDVTLDDDVYKAIGITDEELTLDIVSFGTQVLDPAIGAVARGLEDSLVTAISGATYEVELELDADPYNTLVDARKALNDARVPMSERGLVVGSSVEAAILKSEHLSRFDQSGDNNAFRDASIGRIAGFNAVSAPGLPPEEAYAFHRSAFVLANRGPAVPAGVAFGYAQAFAGFALRVIRDYDFTNVRDRLLVNSYSGTGVNLDNGHFDTNGQWIPAEEADSDYDAPTLVRAVKIALAGS